MVPNAEGIQAWQYGRVRASYDQPPPPRQVRQVVNCESGERRSQPRSGLFARPGGYPRSRSLALYVQLQLLADDIFIETGAELFLQAVCEGELHVLNAPVLHELRQEGAGLPAVVIANKILDHLDGETARKIEHRVVKKKGDELVHSDLRRGGRQSLRAIANTPKML